MWERKVAGTTYALLDVLADLVVELEPLVQSLKLVLVNVTSLEGLHARGRRRREEVEERVGRDDLLDDAGLVGRCGGDTRRHDQPDAT